MEHGSKQIRRVPFSFQYTDLTSVAIKLGNSLQHGVEAQYFMQWYSHWMFSSSSNFWPSFNFYLYIPPPPPPPPPVEPSETSTKIDLCRFNRSFIAVEYASSDLNVSTRRTKTKSWEWSQVVAVLCRLVWQHSIYITDDGQDLHEDLKRVCCC